MVNGRKNGWLISGLAAIFLTAHVATTAIPLSHQKKAFAVGDFKLITASYKPPPEQLDGRFEPFAMMTSLSFDSGDYAIAGRMLAELTRTTQLHSQLTPNSTYRLAIRDGVILEITHQG
jgi:hypothetical protein